MASKLIKDPVHGYVKIEGEDFLRVLDTAEFQRLRHVIQTSYTSLYPAAVHNRFIHSIGVYHLAKNAIEQLVFEADEEQIKNQLQECKRTFLMAAFLHDVGHAPLSHTCEHFFTIRKNDNKEAVVYAALKDIVASDELNEDINLKKEKAQPSAAEFFLTPHEVMSAVIGINLLREQKIEGIDSEFFARSIIGIEYSLKSNTPNKEELSEKDFSKTIKNCLISLLNSKIIDVDKLDYSLRDSVMAGYKSTSIDVDRLFSGLSIRKLADWENKEYGVVFHKNALSVLENAVYANDYEKKWIQTHPVILYEAALVQLIIRKIYDLAKPNGNTKPYRELFTIDALTKKGVCLDATTTVRMLADQDLHFILKNDIRINQECASEIKEYISRQDRKKPMWKSFSEYMTMRSGQERIIKGITALEYHVEELVKLCSLRYGSVMPDTLIAINDALLEDLSSNYPCSAATRLVCAMREVQKDELFRDILAFDFAIIKPNVRFSSGFDKKEFSNLKIWFPATECANEFSKTQTTLSTTKQEYEEEGTKGFFYLYYRRLNGNAFSAKNYIAKVNSVLEKQSPASNN